MVHVTSVSQDEVGKKRWRREAPVKVTPMQRLASPTSMTEFGNKVALNVARLGEWRHNSGMASKKLKVKALIENDWAWGTYESSKPPARLGKVHMRVAASDTAPKGENDAGPW